MKKLILFFITMPFIFNAQSIVSISPNTGQQGQPISVSITGQNTTFQQGTNVIKLYKSGTTIYPTSYNFVNNLLANATFSFTGAHPAGAYDVVVDHFNPSYSATLSAGFLLTAANSTLASISPTSASQGDTITMTLGGSNTNFSTVANTVWLSNGATTITSQLITVISDSVLEAKFFFSYANPLGYYTAHVSNSLNGNMQLSSAVLLNTGPLSPTLLSVSPNTCQQNQQITVSISGQNTSFQQGTNMISLHNGATTIAPLNTSVISNTLVNATFSFTSSHPIGLYDVVVNSSANTLTLAGGFSLSAFSSSLASMSPATATQGDTIIATLTGNNTHFSGLTNAVSLTNGATSINAQFVTLISDSILEAKFIFGNTDPLGYYIAHVSNSIDGNLLMNNALLLNPGPLTPAIQSISPNTATQGQTLSVSITGQNTMFQQGTNLVYLYNGSATISPTSKTVISNTLINATFSISSLQQTGLYDVKVGNYTLYAGFSVTAPSTALVSMSPTTATQGDTIVATITGTNTNFAAGTNTVWLSNGASTINSQFINILSDSALQAKFIFGNTDPLGYYIAHVSNSVDGNLLKSNALLLYAGAQTAAIKSMSPNYAVQGQTLTVSITGQNTTFQQGTNLVYLYNGGPAIMPTSKTVINDTLLNATFSFTTANTIGLYNLMFNQLTMYNAFTLYDTSTSSITGISPSSAFQGDSLTLTVTGLNTNFGAGGDSLWLKNIYGDIIYPAGITIVNSTTIQAQFNFTTSHLPVSYTLFESNTADSISFISNAFTLDAAPGAPVITNVNPNNYVWNQNVTINFTGTGTHFTTSTDTISLVNSLLRTTDYIYPISMSIINDTWIQATFSLVGVDAGDYDILVQGSENIILPFGFSVMNPVPVNEITVGPDFSIFPNPSSGLFNLTINNTLEGGELSITDIQGKELYFQKALKRNSTLDLSYFPSGMYFIKLKKDDQLKTGKIIRN